MLHLPDLNRRFTVKSDASIVAVGGVLTQLVDGIERIAAFESKRLTNTKRRYLVHELEMLAISHCCSFGGVISRAPLS